MDALAQNVKALVRLRDNVIVNKCSPSSPTETVSALRLSMTSAASSPAGAVLCSSSTTHAIVTCVETLVTRIVRILSSGLYAGLDLWSVLATLERRFVTGGSGNGNATDDLAFVTVSQDECSFAASMITFIKTSFSNVAEVVKTRAFVRQALNRGCLLACLEILARFYEPIVEGYMMDEALLRSYGTNRWDRFVSVIAPIGGPPLDVVLAMHRSQRHSHQRSMPKLRGSLPIDNDGDDEKWLESIAKTRIVSFDLDLIVPEFDFCPPYMTAVKLFVAGLNDAAAPEIPIQLLPGEEDCISSTPAGNIGDTAADQPLIHLPEQASVTIVISPPTAQQPEAPVAKDDDAAPAHHDAAHPSAMPTADKVTKRTVVKKVVVRKVVVRKKSASVMSAVESSPTMDDDDSVSPPPASTATATQENRLIESGLDSSDVASFAGETNDTIHSFASTTAATARPVVVVPPAALDEALDILEHMIATRKEALERRLATAADCLKELERTTK